MATTCSQYFTDFTLKWKAQSHLKSLDTERLTQHNHGRHLIKMQKRYQKSNWSFRWHTLPRVSETWTPNTFGTLTTTLAKAHQHNPLLLRRIVDYGHNCFRKFTTSLTSTLPHTRSFQFLFGKALTIHKMPLESKSMQVLYIPRRRTNWPWTSCKVPNCQKMVSTLWMCLKETGTTGTSTSKRLSIWLTKEVAMKVTW